MPVKYPAVSAIVNTHKRPDLLPRALQSVLHQTYTDFEVLVVHDGPADEQTIEVCKMFADAFEQRDIDFVFFCTDEQSGYQCVPKNAATRVATGDYIAYLDDDNEWTADHLEVLVGAMEEGVVWPDLAYGRREYVIDPGAPTEWKGTKLVEGPSPFVPWNEEAAKRLAASAVYNFIDTSDFVVAKGALWRLYDVTGRWWNENLRRFADWEIVTCGAFFGDWRLKGVDAIVQRYHWTGKNVQLTRPATETPRPIKAEDIKRVANA